MLIKMYCPRCGCNTFHNVTSEDGLGMGMIGRTLTALVTFGGSLIDNPNTKFCKCCSCGRTKTI